jgi:hypothetical protein
MSWNHVGAWIRLPCSSKRHQVWLRRPVTSRANERRASERHAHLSVDRFALLPRAELAPPDKLPSRRVLGGGIVEAEVSCICNMKMRWPKSTRNIQVTIPGR